MRKLLKLRVKKKVRIRTKSIKKPKLTSSNYDNDESYDIKYKHKFKVLITELDKKVRRFFESRIHLRNTIKDTSFCNREGLLTDDINLCDCILCKVYSGYVDVRDYSHLKPKKQPYGRF